MISRTRLKYWRRTNALTYRQKEESRDKRSFGVTSLYIATTMKALTRAGSVTATSIRVLFVFFALSFVHIHMSHRVLAFQTIVLLTINSASTCIFVFL